MRPSLMTAATWDQVFIDMVIPRLRSSHDAAGRPAWHANIDAGPMLARALLNWETSDSERLIEALIDQGASLEPLFHEVFEPAARCLGVMSDNDECDDFKLAAAMGRLQVATRRVGSMLGTDAPATQPGYTVLMALQPGELHGLNAAMGSELLMHHGWEVSQQFPSDDRMLREALHEQWYDVLDISQSPALRRDQQLLALRVTILGARAASLNPALGIVVDGRCFFEQPDAYREVGADMGCGTATDLEAAVQWVLESALSVRAGCGCQTYRR